MERALSATRKRHAHLLANAAGTEFRNETRNHFRHEDRKCDDIPAQLTSTIAGSNNIFLPSSSMETLMVRDGIFGLPGSPAEKCSWLSWAAACNRMPLNGKVNPAPTP